MRPGVASGRMKDVVIVAAARTPFGKLGGGLSTARRHRPRCPRDPRGARPHRHGGGRRGPADHGHRARRRPGPGALAPGRPQGRAAVERVPSFTVNKVCASALKAVNLGALLIGAGEAEVVVAGGMESMSRAPYLLEDQRFGARLGDRAAVDSVYPRRSLLPRRRGAHGRARQRGRRRARGEPRPAG